MILNVNIEPVQKTGVTQVTSVPQIALFLLRKRVNMGDF